MFRGFRPGSRFFKGTLGLPQLLSICREAKRTNAGACAPLPPSAVEIARARGPAAAPLEAGAARAICLPSAGHSRSISSVAQVGEGALTPPHSAQSTRPLDLPTRLIAPQPLNISSG